eukprot:3885342-Pleurochrysis_carterae.AAC.1
MEKNGLLFNLAKIARQYAVLSLPKACSTFIRKSDLRYDQSEIDEIMSAWPYGEMNRRSARRSM